VTTTGDRIPHGQLCACCWHQVAVHVAGRAGTGWAIYDRTWAAATGACAVTGCPCDAAYRTGRGDPGKSFLPVCTVCRYRLDPVLAAVGSHVNCGTVQSGTQGV
jgi:hypothetical protein